MSRLLQNVMVTGGAGFIGSNFIRHVLKQKDFTGRIINVDKLTYAGNLKSLIDVDGEHGGRRYFFEKADICDADAMRGVFERYGVDTVVHFAAESHVDRSIYGPGEFITTNIVGTHVLLDAARAAWGDGAGKLFHHVSTDEVFGSLGASGHFYESTAYDPRSPYSASKASSDHLVRAYAHTYGLPVTVSNCSNNYGPYQFPEKLIPLMIMNITEEKTLPVYGKGENVRDWLFVDDHCSGIWQILKKGAASETYNIGGENEWKNIDIVHFLCESIASVRSKPADYYKKLITFVKDRPGHDFRYAINCDKIKRELGWKQSVSFEEGIRKTIGWYLENGAWIESVRTGEYRRWIEKNYSAERVR